MLLQGLRFSAGFVGFFSSSFQELLFLRYSIDVGKAIAGTERSMKLQIEPLMDTEGCETTIAFSASRQSWNVCSNASSGVYGCVGCVESAF